MRAFFFAACLMSVSAASGEDLNTRAHPLPLPLKDQKNATSGGRANPQSRELLGDALGNWMGVKDGRWDVFNAALFDDGTPSGKTNSPTIAGTVRADAALIQLRWHPGE
jgi:hypothetical protein